VLTVEQGYVWVFAAAEHWNAECMGWHASKEGTRFAALEPVSQGVLAEFGSVERSAACGAALRPKRARGSYAGLAVKPLGDIEGRCPGARISYEAMLS